MASQLPALPCFHWQRVEMQFFTSTRHNVMVGGRNCFWCCGCARPVGKNLCQTLCGTQYQLGTIAVVGGNSAFMLFGLRALWLSLRLCGPGNVVEILGPSVNSVHGEHHDDRRAVRTRLGQRAKSCRSSPLALFSNMRPVSTVRWQGRRIF